MFWGYLGIVEQKGLYSVKGDMRSGGSQNAYTKNKPYRLGHYTANCDAAVLLTSLLNFIHKWNRTNEGNYKERITVLAYSTKLAI